jgi:hypothetical protein
MPEFGIRLDSDQIVVGPHWESVAEVIDSYHGHGVRRVYGQLITRDDNQQEWRLADGYV